MEGFTEGSMNAPISRYFRLPEDKRLEFKRRQKARYWQNADSIRRRCYQRVLDAGKIRCPKKSTLEKYGFAKEQDLASRSERFVPMATC